MYLHLAQNSDVDYRILKVRIVIVLQACTRGAPVSLFVGVLFVSGMFCLLAHVHSANFAPAGSPSRGGDVAVYAFDKNQPSLPTPFYSVLVLSLIHI